MHAVHIRAGGYQPPASVHNRAARLLGDALAARLGEAVRFELEDNIVASGHNAADLLEWVGSGRIEMCYFSTSYLANEAPQLAALDSPFVFERREQAYALLDGALGEEASAQLARTRGYKVLGYFDNGFRHITNRLRPLRRPQDCKGLRIRTLASEAHARVFRRLGFEPVALDVKDLVPALRAGTVDAQDNPLTNIYNFGVHRYHRHLTLSAHFWGAAALLCHGESYARWPAEVRSAVAAAAGEAVAAQRRLAAAEDDEVLASLEAAGCDIVRLSPEERALWKEAST
ncbi:MAG TPA: TRAP transporter substrate-binding protein [Burkholderiales bacterium]|nr:TRAP transporter substrate-binding protein [Burkholderiales bacterium]